MPGSRLAGRVRLTGIAAARRRIVDPTHAAGIIAVPVVTVLAGILGKPGVNFLGRHAGIGGIEQRPLGQFETGLRQQRVDCMVTGDIPAPEVATFAACVM